MSLYTFRHLRVDVSDVKNTGNGNSTKLNQQVFLTFVPAKHRSEGWSLLLNDQVGTFTGVGQLLTNTTGMITECSQLFWTILNSLHSQGNDHAASGSFQSLPVYHALSISLIGQTCVGPQHSWLRHRLSHVRVSCRHPVTSDCTYSSSACQADDCCLPWLWKPYNVTTAERWQSSLGASKPTI